MQRLGHDDAQEQPNPEFRRLRADTGSSAWTWERRDESTACGAAGPVDARPAGRGRLRRRGRAAAGRRAAGGHGLPRRRRPEESDGRPERDAEPERRAERDAEARVPAGAGRPRAPGARAGIGSPSCLWFTPSDDRRLRPARPGEELSGFQAKRGLERTGDGRRTHLAATGSG